MTRALVLMFVVALAPSSALACGMEMEPEGVSLAALLDEIDAVEEDVEVALDAEVAAAEAELDRAIVDVQDGLNQVGAVMQALSLELQAVVTSEPADVRVVASNGVFENQ